MFIPILDTAFVSFHAETVFPVHFSRAGPLFPPNGGYRISEKKAVVILYIFAFSAGLLAMCLYPLDAAINWVIVSLYLLLILFFWAYLAKWKFIHRTLNAVNRSTKAILPRWIEAGFGPDPLLSVLMDLILITAAYYAAYLLRFGGVIGADFDFFFKIAPHCISCQMTVFIFFRVYQRWRLGVTQGCCRFILKIIYQRHGARNKCTIAFLHIVPEVFPGRHYYLLGVILIFALFSGFFRLLDKWINKVTDNK
ncbi:MAG: hypothetical protein R2874_04890 [Desulfobacterales bacterium]